MKTAGRLLALLALLQQRRAWTGPQLATELAVTTRTIRNDVERLRELGYPIVGSPGLEGGYRLRVGSELPPLLLDDDEAVATAVGLRWAATGAVSGIEELSLRAMNKLEQFLPKRIRKRVATLARAIVALPTTEALVDSAVLSQVALACDRQQRLSFSYRDHAGHESSRVCEPYRVVHDGRRWYLIAYDLGRGDFRTFRVDRLRPAGHLGPAFVARAVPEAVLLASMKRGIDRATWHVRARVKVKLSAEALARRVPPAVSVEPLDETHCVASVGADTFEALGVYLGMFGCDFEVIEPAELRLALRALGRRYLRAAREPKPRIRVRA
ncbi:MAG TPA: YafY family protein [Polyangiaceae bacterium]